MKKARTKKALALALSVIMALALFAGCASNGTDKPDTSTPAATPGTTATPGADNSTAPDETEGEEINIRISTVLTEESLTGQALAKFAEGISERTDGRITADIYYSGVLGTTDAVMEMVQEGDVQMETLNPVVYETQVVELSTLDQYYMFESLEHAHNFLEGDGGKYLNKAWTSIGVEGLATFALGFRELSNSVREVSTIEDMKSLTLRGYSTIQIAAWQAVGATPTSVDWGELFVSMQQGLLDGQESALSTINDFSFYEVQKYITMTDHVFTCDMLVASSAWLETLSDSDRAIIEEEIQNAYDWHKEAYQADLANMIEKFESEYGIVVTYPSDEVKAQMAEVMSAVTAEEIIKVCGQEVYDAVQGYVEAARP